MEFDKLTTGDRVIGVSALLLLAFSFLDWLGLKQTGAIGVDPSTSQARDAWAFPVTMIAVVIGLVMLVTVVLKLLGGNQPAAVGRFSWGQVLMIAGVIAFGLIAVKLVIGPGSWTDANGHRFTFDQLNQLCRGLSSGTCDGVAKTRGIGIYLGVLAGAGLALGGYLRVQEERGMQRSTARARAATA
jgi:hypothetical protein